MAPSAEVSLNTGLRASCARGTRLRLGAALARDWPYLAFARGYLDPRLLGGARYWVACHGDGEPGGVLAHVRNSGASFSVLAGDAGDAAALLAHERKHV